MEELNLSVELRSETGSASNRRFRKEGKLPFVVYRKATQAVNGLVDENEFVKLASKSRSSQVFRFESASQELNGLSVIVKDIQKQYVKGELLHVDFQSLAAGEEVVVTVPLEVVGEPVGVKTQGGVLSVSLHQVRVRCVPENIPTSVKLDVTALELGGSLKKADLELPENVKLADEPRETICTVVGTRASRMMKDEA